MAQIVKLRRSSVSGQKPTNSNLQLGELALNTTDGKVFMAVSGSGGPSVQELISTNTVNTGSIYLTDNVTASFFTGSFIGDGSQLYNIPSTGVTGLQLNKIISGSVSASISPDRGLEINTKTTITGSITLALTEDPDPNGTTTVATHLFVSASNNQTGEDLYIRQQDNKVKWKWIEGKLNTGILWGGVLSYSGSNIYITKGSGIIVNHRASATQEISPITHYVNWNDITASCYHLTSSLATYVGVDMSGSLYQQDNYFSVNQYRETIPLGMFNHTNKSTITSLANDVITAYDDVNQTSNFIQAFGPLKLEGLTLQAQSGNLQLTVDSGQSYIYGGFYQQNPNDVSHKTTSQVVTPQIARVRRDGNGSFIVDNNNGSFYTTIETSHWDDGTGTLNSLGGNYSIQRVFFNPFTNRVHVYYGQATYGNKTLAIQGLSTDPFVEAPYSSHQYVFLGYLIIKGGTSNLADTGTNTIVQSGLFRNTVGANGGAQTLATLHDLSDVDIATEANGDLLSYNSTTGKWTHGKSLNGTYEITGSLNVTGGLTGSINYLNLINLPTLVSSSEQVVADFTFTTDTITNTDVNIVATSGDIILNADGNVYKGSASAGNGLVTDGYLDIIIGDTSRINTGTGHSITDNLDGISNTFNSFTSSYTTGSFTGSFIGDGSGLYNLPNVSGGTAKLAYFNTDHSVTSSYFAHITNTGNTLGLGTDGYTIAQPERLVVDNGKSYNIATFQTSKQESYAEVNIKNFGSGSASSTDLVLWNNQTTEENNYVNLGINSSNYTADNVGYNNDGYLFSSDNDLYVGSLSSGSHGHLHLFAGNLWKSSSLSIYNDGTIGINTDKDNNNATTIPSSTNGFAVEISGSVKFRNDIVVQGTITAEEIHTSYVTSSVLYRSGSNKFGNTEDDIHQFTGSVQITGSLYLNGQSIATGKLNSTEFYTYTSSINPRLQSLESESGSIRNEFNVHTSSVNFDLYSLHVESGSMRSTFNTFTSSYRTGSFTGSFYGDASGLNNVPFFISGSDIDGNQYAKTFYKLHFDSDTGLNVSESVQGTAFISIGSHFKDIFVSGSPILSATGSDAFEIIPEGGVEIVTSITDTNYNSYTKELKISTLALSSSLDNRIKQITGSLNNFTSSINTFTSSVVLTSQTSSMSVLSSSFAFNAVTAAFALNASAGSSTTNDGAYKILVQSTPATTWTFNHQMGQRYPIFQVFDTDGKVIIPTEITTVNSDNATITFSVPTAGKAIASLGVGSGGLSQYFSTSTTWSLAHNLNVDYPLVNVWDTNRNIIIPDRIESIDTNNIKVYLSAPKAGYLNVAKGGHIISGSVNAGNVDFTSTNIVSSSAQIRNHGFAITGSNIFVAPQTINSNLTITGTASVGNATIKQCTVTGITTSSAICSLATGSYNGAFFDYVVKNGVNMRAGTIMSAWEGGSVVYNETSTNDLGNTNAVTMSVNISGGNARLFAQVSSGTWSVSTLTRAIGGMGTTGAGTNYQISTGYTAPDYCSGLFGTDQSVYGDSSDWLTITRFFTDSSLTTPFNGNSKYYGNSNADYGTTLQIDSSGYVIGSYAC